MLLPVEAKVRTGPNARQKVYIKNGANSYLLAVGFLPHNMLPTLRH